MAVRHVARHFELNWQTVNRLDRQRLERTLGPAALDGIEVIAMDEFAIQKGHRCATQRYCPNAAIVFDLFHIIAKYGREVIDRVRVDRAKRRSPARKLVKSGRWLLLKNRNSMRPEEDVELEELLAANHDLFAVYVLRDALKDLWRYRHPAHADRAWRWYRKALRCRIEPLRRFARNPRPLPARHPRPLQAKMPTSSSRSGPPSGVGR
jgi:transposase